jgi:hypothetical protein
MAERQPNESRIIAWHLVAKNLIKFTNDEKSYKCNDKVLAANDFTKFPLNKGDSVEVGIQENVITFLRKQKSETKLELNGSEEAYEPTEEDFSPENNSQPVSQIAPKPIPAEVKKEEQKVEAPKVETQLPDGVTNVCTLTVFAVAANKKVVKFTEIKDDGWYTIDEKIQAQDYATIGLIAKNMVKVTFADKMVTSLVKVASEPAESSQDKPREEKVDSTTTSTNQFQNQKTDLRENKKEWKPAPAYDSAEKQTSIEAQAAVNGANQVVGRVAANIDPKPNATIINNMIRAIAEANFALIQELKSK